MRRRGDAALFDYTAKFDRLSLSAETLPVAPEEIERALAAVSKESLAALQLATTRIADYHRRQKSETWLSTDEPDILLGQMVRPLDRVGIYVPGGKAAYPSSVLMNAVPAKVAGVAEVIMVVPMPGGEVNPHVLAVITSYSIHYTKLYDDIRTIHTIGPVLARPHKECKA